MQKEMSGDNPEILMGKEGRKEGRRKEGKKEGRQAARRPRPKAGRGGRRELEYLEEGTMS